LSQIKLYLDEDAMHRRLVAALHSRGVETVTAIEANLVGNPDEDHLAFATAHDCVLYSFNVSDFCRIHSQFIRAGGKHAGMILAPQQKFSVGEQTRRILRIHATTNADSMRNRIEFLGNWG